MKILAAYDLGADGVELLVHLDEDRTIVGPDGDDDVRPHPAWLWRTTVPGNQWKADQVGALQRVAKYADREKARRNRPVLTELQGISLADYLTADPTPAPPVPAPAEPVEDVD